MYHIFYMDKGHCMVFNLNSNTTFHGLLDMVSSEVGHKPADLIMLDETGAALESNKMLCEMPEVGTSTTPVYLFLKSGTDKEGHLNSDVTYVFQMIDDAVDQAQYVLKEKDPLKVYMELPEKAKDCRRVCTETLQMCATLVEQHRFLHKGWLALINNLDNSVSKMEKRGKRFKNTHQKMEELLEKSDSLLLNYSDVVEQLRRIEVPNGLIPKPALSASTIIPPTDDKCTLFDFIAKADPEASLEDLPEIVHEKIKQLEEQNVKSVYSTLKHVHEQSQNQEFREFKGINKRFSQLEFSLNACEERKDVIHKFVGQIVETPKNMDQSKLPSTVEDHRRYMKVVFENFLEFRNMVKVFDQSKQEILKNLRTRMAGFVVQSYDRLRTVHNDILQYEYKGNAVRIHMDLIGQIRDAPTLFSQSVSEVVRRRLLKAELDEWHLDHSNKCTQFSTDEEKNREQLSRKLRKHFLHVLFPGLFDKLPQFFVKAPLEKYDAELPNIAKDYIKELRDAVPELEPYLKVTIPNVANKLAPKGVKPHPPFGQTRHESFLTEEPMRMARSHFNYSPAAWLSEDGGDSSPIPQQMCCSPSNMMRESSCQSIPYVPSLQQIEGLDGPPGSSAASSAPISIPHATSSRINFKQSGRQMSSQDIPHVGSAISSDTSLLGHETPVRDDMILSIKKQENAVQQSNMSNSSESLDSLFDVYEKIDYSADDILIGINDHTAELEDAVKRLGIMQNFVANMQPRNDKIFKYLCQTAPRDFELIIHDSDKMKVRVKELGESVESLETELESRKNTETDLEAKLNDLATKHQKDIEDTQAECIKRLSVEFELMTDSMSRQNKELLESKDSEIEELKAKIEKMAAAHEKALKNDPYTEEYKKNLTADIRAELEKEFKQRIDMITKAVEAKKDEAFARQQKTLEIENRVLSSENEAKSKKLDALHGENEQLESLIRQMPEGEIILEEFNALKESQPAVQIKDRFAAIRSKMDKSTEGRHLDNNKIFLIDNILKTHKLQQLVNERQKYRDVVRNQAGGDQVLQSLESKSSTVAVDMEAYWKELSATNITSDENGRKVAKIEELQMEIVWLQSLVRSIPNGPSVQEISSALHQESHQKDVETVTSISMLNIFMDHDREEIKKLARAMQLWLNTSVTSLSTAGTYALEDSPKVKECASKYKSLAMKAIPSVQIMEESFYQPMAASTLNVTTSPSDFAFEVERSSLNTICTQTRLCMPAMNLLVSVQDIKIGSVVLVIWHQVHNAYVIFCSSSHRFFVKESSIRRLGINTSDDTTRRNWIIARVVRSDSCSIKKPVNRYNLPVGTIVRRVEVESVNMDFEGDFNEISIA